MNRQVEILAPAGSYDSLRAAVCAGADAVYIGGTRFGARAYAKNFPEEEMLGAIDYVHIHGRRIYLTVNTLLKDWEMEQLYAYLQPYYLRGLDGVIVQDVGVMKYVKTYFPDLPIHASTQMTITNVRGAAFLREQGVSRVVPARELSLAEIRRMKEETGLEIECFIHGALCYCYSGQCLLSSMIGGRSGNRGQCAQPCRLPYSCQSIRQMDIMSLKDLCTIDLLPELVEAGIDSFKIEGRMKQPDYVYTVVSMYRRYMDLYLREGKEKYKVAGDDREELLSAYQRRGYTDGYYKRHNGKDMISFQRPKGREEESGLSKHPEYKLQEKINGNLILSSGERAKLILKRGRHQVECEGAVPEFAKRQPLDTARVEKQMRKTGNTEFVFEHFHVTMKEDLFLPIQGLNELRREGLEKLSESILSEHRRGQEALVHVTSEPVASQPVMAKTKPVQTDADLPEAIQAETAEGTGIPVKPQISLSAMVQSMEQLEAAMAEESVKVIYIDSTLGLQREWADRLGRAGRKKRYYLALPYIFREDTIRKMEASYPVLADGYDGVLIRSWDSYRWLMEHRYTKEIRSDYNLYVFNRYSKAFLREQGIEYYTVPLELNSRELQELDIRGGILIGYGYQPVMITANCIQKSSGRCSGEEGYLKLCDRYQKQFAVKKCCEYCYNIIYNSAPLFLADKAEEIGKLAPGEVRLDFTTEASEEATRLIRGYADAFVHHRKMETPETEFTRGHFKRGVK